MGYRGMFAKCIQMVCLSCYIFIGIYLFTSTSLSIVFSFLVVPEGGTWRGQMFHSTRGYECKSVCHHGLDDDHAMWCNIARSIWYYLPRLQGSAVLAQGIVQFHSRYCHWTECPPSWDTHWLLYEYRTAAHSRSFLNVGISNTRDMNSPSATVRMSALVCKYHQGHEFSFCYCTYEYFGGW